MSTYAIHAVEAASKRRARLGWWRGIVVGGFTVAAFLTLAVRVEHQDAVLRDYVREQCWARRTAVLQTNADWDALARIERQNTFVSAELREARLRIYSRAKVAVPVCP